MATEYQECYALEKAQDMNDEDNERFYNGEFEFKDKCFEEQFYSEFNAKVKSALEKVIMGNDTAVKELSFEFQEQIEEYSTNGWIEWEYRDIEIVDLNEIDDIDREDYDQEFHIPKCELLKMFVNQKDYNERYLDDNGNEWRLPKDLDKYEDNDKIELFAKEFKDDKDDGNSFSIEWFIDKEGENSYYFGTIHNIPNDSDLSGLLEECEVDNDE